MLKRNPSSNHVRIQSRGWKWLAALCACLVLMQFGLAIPSNGKGKPGGGGSSPAVVYRVTVIENPLPDSPLYVLDLSGTGEAVGFIRGPEERIPFVWTTDTGLVPLQILLSEQDQQLWHLETAEEINDSGRIVGFASVQGEDANENWAAFRLDWHDGRHNCTTILKEA